MKKDFFSACFLIVVGILLGFLLSYRYTWSMSYQQGYVEGMKNKDFVGSEEIYAVGIDY